MRWVRHNELKGATMGTVIEMHSRGAIDAERVEALLSRLEWRLDEPCDVPGCAHGGESCGVHDEMFVAAAA